MNARVKKYILFDHDGVLVDTEHWYYKAGERALAEIGLLLDPDQYVLDMSHGAGTWPKPRRLGLMTAPSTGCVRSGTPTTRSTCGPRQSRSTVSSRPSPNCRTMFAWRS